MTALETFTTASKQPLTTGRRPDMAAICAKLSLQLVMVAVAAGGREGSARRAPDRASRETGS
jgi:hypothetical protein